MLSKRERYILVRGGMLQKPYWIYYHQSAPSIRPQKASCECSPHMHWLGCLELQWIFTLKWNLIESFDNALFLQPNLAQSRAFELQPHCSRREEKDSSSQHPIWFQAELISRLIKRLDEFSTDVRSYVAWLKILDLPSHRVLFRRTVTAGSFEMGTSSCRPRQEQMNLIRDAFSQKDRHLCFSSHSLFLRGE